MKNKYKNVVIAGDIGTGTSTLAKGLAEKLGWKLVSVGDFFRKYHKEHNLPLWNKMAIPVDVELEADKKYIAIIENEKNVVLDGHYLGWFAKDLEDVFKILLTTDKNVATKRITDRKHTHKENPDEIDQRRKELMGQFKKLYTNENYEDPKLFDLVIDTTTVGKNKTLQIAYEALEKGY